MQYERHFFDLHAAVDHVQTYLQSQADVDRSTEALHRLKLAIHEWMGNLVHHARFSKDPPEVYVRLWKQDRRLHCIIEDNSDGFDFDAQLKLRQEAPAPARTLPDGGMGLLLMRASTEQAAYLPLEDQRNRLYLSVRIGRRATDEKEKEDPATSPAIEFTAVATAPSL